MNLPYLKRHWFHYGINAFFLFLILEDCKSFPQYPIILDHIGQHQFNTFPYLPNIQVDYYISNLIIDGSLPVSISSYRVLTNNFSNIKDSLDQNGHSFFSYRQGDYLYRDLIVYKEIQLNDSINIKLTGQTRSFPGPYNNLGPRQSSSNNSLQNSGQRR